jgi:4-hydroxy-tetrahydrodipicolinate synthase
MQEREIRGVVAVVPVPFAADETVDEASLRTTVGWLAERRVGGLCLPAYGSEFYKLSEAERERVVAVALEANRRRLPLVAQANHGSSRIAAATARRYQELGADLIAFAIPRQFASSEADLLRYCGRIADAVSVPVLIQDFNPGGQTIGPDFIDALNRAHPNFRYAKLEEPLIADKLVAIRERVGDRVRVLEGWGGFYMLEAIPAGICGIMPGAPLADLLQIVFDARSAGDDRRAYDLFSSLLPFINFALQDFELFLQVEKRLAVRRGLMRTATVRDLTFTPSRAVLEHTDFLIEQVMRVVKREELA